jgi:hypothetical protein
LLNIGLGNDLGDFAQPHLVTLLSGEADAMRETTLKNRHLEKGLLCKHPDVEHLLPFYVQGDLIGRIFLYGIGRLLSLGCDLKITEVAPIFGQLFFHGTRYLSITSDEKWAGLHVFTNSSGHPGFVTVNESIFRRSKVV